MEAGIPIFLLEAGKNADGQTGETGGQVSVCKETFLIRPPAREKSNYLSVIELSYRRHGRADSKNILCSLVVHFF